MSGDDWDEVVGSVVVSGIDPKVWVAVLPDTDQWDGAMQASTSLRKCKAHVERKVREYLGHDVAWTKVEAGHWDAYLPPGVAE